MSKTQNPGPAASHGQARSTLDTDGMLTEWGARLFYQSVRGKADNGGGKLPLMAIAAAITPKQIRSLVKSTVAPGAKQVMVKITGGGRGMKAIAAHFRYISRLGKEEAGGKGATLEIEDERGEKIEGKAGLARLVDDWRIAGAYIDDDSLRREAYNIIFSMPPGTPAEAVRGATAEAAHELFEGYKYVFVLHEEQGAPHVHLAVRADRFDGVRLNPRKADLDRWRAVFARGLQDRGINAVATRQPVRAANRSYRKLWEEKAIQRGTLKRQRPTKRTSVKTLTARADAIRSWEQIARALADSKDSEDVRLARDIVRYLAEVAPGGQEAALRALQRAQRAEVQGPQTGSPQSGPASERSR
jgi:hypothetical protein